MPGRAIVTPVVIPPEELIAFVMGLGGIRVADDPWPDCVLSGPGGSILISVDDSLDDFLEEEEIEALTKELNALPRSIISMEIAGDAWGLTNWFFERFSEKYAGVLRSEII